MCVFDRETLRCLAVNPAALRLYGYSRDEFLGLALTDTRHPAEDIDHASLWDSAAFPRHCGTRRLLKKSGDVFLADVVVQDVLFDGRPAALMLLLETSERARTHTLSLERERLFSALVENSPDVIARIDRELRHVYVNPAVSAATGVTAEQVMRRDRQLGVPLELCVRWAAGARRVFATGKQQEIEISFPTAEGERHYASHMVPELGADGRVESVLAIARDVTERKRVEIALRASENSLRQRQREFEALADALPQVIACFDRELRHTYANAAIERASGMSRADMVGRTSAEVGFPASLVELWEESLRRVFDTGETSKIDFEYQTADGMVQYEADHIPLKREDGTVDAVICVASDITHLKRAEEERLATMSRQRDTLIREVHHRVKNNLQGVVGLLRQLGSMHTSLGPLLDKAVSQLQAMAVVHGLHGRELRAGVLLDGIVAEVAQLAERANGVSVWYTRAARAGAPLHVRENDAVAIALVLNELVLNAAKHGSSKRDKGTVAVGLSTDGGAARITVVNDGKLPSQFDFDTGKGLGTGLELVQALLPTQGAHLAFSRTDGRVEAALELDSPVLERGAEAPKEMLNEWDRRQRPYSDRRR